MEFKKELNEKVELTNLLDKDILELSQKTDEEVNKEMRLWLLQHGYTVNVAS